MRRSWGGDFYGLQENGKAQFSDHPPLHQSFVPGWSNGSLEWILLSVPCSPGSWPCCGALCVALALNLYPLCPAKGASGNHLALLTPPHPKRWNISIRISGPVWNQTGLTCAEAPTLQSVPVLHWWKTMAELEGENPPQTSKKVQEEPEKEGSATCRSC